MSFKRANIDRAIVLTQYGLHGFAHPIGSRVKKPNARTLDTITHDFLSFAAGGREDNQPRTQDIADYSSCTNEQYLMSCLVLCDDCDLPERTAIQRIIRDIVAMQELLMEEARKPQADVNPYLRPLSLNNCWGRAVLALAEAFRVDLSDKIAA